MDQVVTGFGLDLLWVQWLKGFHGWDSFAHGRSLISLHQADEL
jgi:hypothetical protein